MSGPPVTPGQAKAIYDALPKPTIPALARELARRGTPVSVHTLAFWRKRQWQVQSRSRLRSAAAAVKEARAAARRAGLPVETVGELEAELHGLSDGELVARITRSLLVNAGVLLERAKEMTPMLAKKDARGLAALFLAADRMVENAHALLGEARNLAERGMKERCGLLLAAPAESVPATPTLRRSFAGVLEKFAAVRPAAPAAEDEPEDVEAVEVIHPGFKSVN
jgi:hypothetical protein